MLPPPIGNVQMGRGKAHLISLFHLDENSQNLSYSLANRVLAHTLFSLIKTPMFLKLTFFVEKSQIIHNRFPTSLFPSHAKVE